MTVTLAEEIMLLSLDDASGAVRERQACQWAVAGGIVLDLVLAGRVSVDRGRIIVVDTAPTGVGLLDGRLGMIGTWAAAGRSRPAKVTAWLTKDNRKALDATVASLAERGLVAEEERKVMGVFPVRRFPEVDGTVERELRARLEGVVLRHAEPDDRTAGLVALLHGAKLYRLTFPDLPPREVMPRMREISEGQWVGASVSKAIREMQSAMTAVALVTMRS
ncbi:MULTISPECIES: GPP34 family phosphoprotein [unclassified Streptomyces]|uniref:GOLPH3/VPS74 family protein n=1 Tax=unclassified Streptomyces TaxID=2593676 RepID=UPI001BE8F5B1|nr:MULTISPECIES: GPP34 family phosphoprotein [unclassified Streptomyces]MBT2406284.1 GPP34 family phosphoprotein [Streptomyces sp. ISL-21]MBT2607399.1 GPP34 family phosphoprotein [Streptomyces sp. ISL-87]